MQPHIVATRSAEPLTEPARQKIAMFSGVAVENVFSMHDRESIYTIPEDLHAIGLDTEVLTKLGLLDRVSTETEEAAREKWHRFVGKLSGARKFSLKLGLTGKYAALCDAYASIDKAIEHVGARLLRHRRPLARHDLLQPRGGGGAARRRGRGDRARRLRPTRHREQDRLRVGTAARTASRTWGSAWASRWR